MPPKPSAAPAFVLTPKIIAGIIVVIVIIALILFFGLHGSSSSPTPKSGAGSSGGTAFSAPGAMTQCPASLSLCNGNCVDLKTDGSNCGACGVPAGSGQVCQNGQPRSAGPSPAGAARQTTVPEQTMASQQTNVPTQTTTVPVYQTQAGCPGGLNLCSGSCRDVTTDEANCGSCGNACMTGQMCQNGQCVQAYTSTPTISLPATLSCPGQTLCSGSCVNVQADTANCGSCGHACPAGQSCQSGQCRVSCPAGSTSCSGVCQYLQYDSSNCGTCGHVCLVHETCVSGQCTCSVPGAPYWKECPGVCTNVHQDNNNCGTCGKVCPVTVPHGQTHCNEGSCLISCTPDGHLDCNINYADGCEVYVMTDVNNCGNCGIRCQPGYSCKGGSCTK